MSTTFAETTKALADNPELAAKVMAAGTPAERAEILKAAGVPVPSHADVSAAHADLTDVSGAGGGGKTTAQVAAGVPAAVPAASAAIAAS